MEKDKIKFIKYTTLFLIILLVMIFIINNVYIGQFLKEKINYRQEKMFYDYIETKEGKKIDLLFLGDSHTATSLNPKIINNSFNLGANADTFFEIYYKLYTIISENKTKIKNIVLGIDLHSFSNEWNNKNAFQEIYIFSKKVPLKNISKLSNKTITKIFIKKYFPVIGKGKEILISLFTNKKKHRLYKGWLNNTKVEYINKSIDAKRALVDFTKEDFVLIDPIVLEHFLKIIKLAKKEKINVIFVRYPLSNEYIFEIEKENIQKELFYTLIFNKINSVLNKNYSFLDYSSIYTSNDDYFADADHLNSKGSTKFSEKFYSDFKKIGLKN